MWGLNTIVRLNDEAVKLAKEGKSILRAYEVVGASVPSGRRILEEQKQKK